MYTYSYYFLGLSPGLSLLTMGDRLFSSSGVVMLTGAAASSTSFSLGQDDSLLDIFSHALVLSTWQVFRYMASITWLPFHNSPFSFIIFIFVLLSCFQWFFRLSRMDGIIWKLTEKPLFEVSPRGNLSRLRAAKSPSNR